MDINESLTLDYETLRDRCSQGEAFEYLFFWGHQVSKRFATTKSCLSQWYAAPFCIDGVRYATAEHWMMASKARLFSDEATLTRILESTDPKSAKAVGRTVRGFDEAIWMRNARQIVKEGNLAKFGQHDELRTFLLKTGDIVLVEACPFDTIWGIGLGAEDKRALHPETWRGKNLLGFALMEVRAELQSTSTPDCVGQERGRKNKGTPSNSRRNGRMPCR